MHLRLVEHLLLGIYFTMLFSITVFSFELCTKTRTGLGLEIRLNCLVSGSSTSQVPAYKAIQDFDHPPFLINYSLSLEGPSLILIGPVVRHHEEPSQEAPCDQVLLRFYEILQKKSPTVRRQFHTCAKFPIHFQHETSRMR